MRRVDGGAKSSIYRMVAGGAGLKRAAAVITVLIGILLLRATVDLPGWGSPDSPASRHVSPYYLQNSLVDTAVPNVVTALLADYRGYDTMYETTVIFCAGITVLIVLRRSRRQSRKPRQPLPEREGRDLILQGGARLLIPVMQLFALYVVAHGHQSPGGGFQGGVILGASFILLAMCYDLRTALRRLGEKPLLIAAAAGVSIYAGIGTLCLGLGGNFLDYAALGQLFGTNERLARSHGIFAVELGVAITVMAIMFSLYIDLASGGDLDEGL